MPSASLQSLDVSRLKGAGPKTLERLQRIGISSIQDLLFHLPLRYEDRTRLRRISQLEPFSEALFEGTVKHAGLVPGRQRSFVCKLEDQGGYISLRFFHFSAAQTRMLKPGTRLRCFGTVRFGRAQLECIHPEYSVIQEGKEPPLNESLTPVYPSTEGLHQASFRKLIGQAITLMGSHSVQELLSEDWLLRLSGERGPSRYSVLPLADTLRALHTPSRAELAHLEKYQQRLALEELLAHHLSLMDLRQSLRAEPAPALPIQHDHHHAFLENLGFELTKAQARVSDELATDLAQPVAMLRLVQGDVGCGKTVVAAIAALRAISAGYQVALMAPTEILAEQHALAFEQWFSKLGLNTAMLSGQQTAKQRREQLARVLDGSAQMVVGTHALIQDKVAFARLGLIIIDEQHRFGVDQRLTLRQKGLESGVCPHQLIMTATPIPRTLAMTAYADLDVSIIDELPPGRTPVHTTVLDNAGRARVVSRVHEACQQGRQAYWVCTLVEDSEVLQCQAAEKTAEELSEALSGLNVGLVHGKMKAAEKAAVMSAFKAAELDLLVATTVIEVGVDVPNASLMIIENAERLGLSQIHQLRGRVGRGSTESHCLLMYQKPLSNTGRQRLETLRSSTDGFYIAEQDLALRGPGEVLGTRQTGMMQFKMADLERDADLLDFISQHAAAFRQQCPTEAAALVHRWLGEAGAYGNA